MTSPAQNTNLRRVGGPPRKIASPAKPARNSKAGGSTSRVVSGASAAGSEVGTKQMPVTSSVPMLSRSSDAAPAGASTRKTVTLRANPSMISQLEFQEEEDEDWDEVVMPHPSHSVTAIDFAASSPAPVSESRPTSRAQTVTDDETMTDRTANTTEVEDNAEEDELDLQAAYGYDFQKEVGGQAGPSTAGSAQGGIEISLGARDGLTGEQRKARDEAANRKKPLTARDRALRLEAHKMHIVCLLASAGIRNKWCCDDLLKSRLLSLTPHPLHAAFHIPPSRIPDAMQRARMFQTALQDLATWWANDFFDVSDPTIGIRTRSWDEVMEIVEGLPRLVQNAALQIVVDAEDGDIATAASKGKLRAKESLDEKVVEDFIAALGKGGERLRTVNSMMKKALQGNGGRDTSAQLFVALCRSLGLGARLVVSIQAVQWKADKQPTTKPPKKKTPKPPPDLVDVALAKRKRMPVRRRGKMPEKTASEEDEEDEMEEVEIPGTMAGGPSRMSTPASTPSSRNKFPKGKGNRLQERAAGTASDPESVLTDASSKSAKLNIGKDGAMNPLKKERAEYYKLGKSKVGQKLGGPSKPKRRKDEDLSKQPPVFWAEVYSRSEQKWIPVDPVRGLIKRKKDFEPSSESGPIRMLYVVAFEEDGYAREVTVRYARNFAAKTMKLRVPVKKDHEDWWGRVMKMLERPYRLQRDDLEDAELEMSQVSEGMPMMMAGFKDHPIYVLERHLKREEVIMPKKEIGRFKGEPVYRRANVVSCRTPESWMRIGRQVKAGQEPLKWVKQRAVTLDRRRAQELANQEGKDPIQQGLYAEWQTEVFRPPPIQDGKVPKNAFGNLDLYVPTMLPEGAVHLPYKGIAKVAKQLGIDYAEACTGFEFKKQRAIPVLTGIAVATEYEDLVMETYWKSTAAAEERALNKKQQRALERWFKLLNGMKIRMRVQAEYGDSSIGQAKTAAPSTRITQSANDVTQIEGESNNPDTETDNSVKRPVKLRFKITPRPEAIETPTEVNEEEQEDQEQEQMHVIEGEDEDDEMPEPDNAGPIEIAESIDDEPELPIPIDLVDSRASSPSPTESGESGKRTSRRAAAATAKKRLKQAESGSDADDEYRAGPSRGVRKSTRLTRSKGRR